MNFAMELGRAAALSEKRAGLGSFVQGLGRQLQPALGRNAVKQTALGATLGAGKAVFEQGTGVLDPNISPEGKAWHFGANVLGGAALGNPAARNAMFFKRTTVNDPRQPGTSITASNFRPITAASAVGGVLAAPYYANATDATRQFGRAAQQAFQTPEFQAAINDPAAYGRRVVSDAAAGAAREIGKSPAAAAGLGSLGNTIGAGVGGSLVGGAVGGIAGRLLAGDDETLDYAARRRRERLRTILGLGGTAAGGLAAPYLMSRYAPNLISNTVNQVTGLSGAK